MYCSLNYFVLSAFNIVVVFSFVVIRPNSVIEQIHVDRNHNAANRDIYRHTKPKEAKHQIKY